MAPLWRDGQVRELVDSLTEKVNDGEYSTGLTLADAMLEMLDEETAAYAYVLGCKKAVCLRHLADEELRGQAEAAFQEAYDLATRLQEPVIAAYIANDWASMRQGDEAVGKLEEAHQLLTGALDNGQDSPDPERVIEADLAYVQATLARIRYSQDRGPEARRLIATAVRTLQVQAREYPRYKAAYRIALGYWLRDELNVKPRNGRWLGRVLRCGIELAKQGKLNTILRLIKNGSLKRHRR